MTTETSAKKAFKETRKFYEGGLKSSNKIYDVEASPWYKRLFGGAASANTRREDASESVSNTRALQRDVARRAPSRVTPLRWGATLYARGTNAGNCGELSCVASARAFADGLPAPQIKCVSLTAPADHVFCMVGDANILALLKNRKVRDLTGMGQPATPIYIVDAWANVCCAYNEYPSKVGAKMQKWLSDGKRIAWVTGPQGPGWYTPHGDYSEAFLDARLIIQDVATGAYH